MSKAEIKASISEMINQIEDEEILKAWHILLQKAITDQNEEVVGYDHEGNPLSKKDINRRIDLSRAQFESGDYITLDEWEEKIKSR